MPFSTKLEQEYKELAEEKLNLIRFDSIQDFDDFCNTMAPLVFSGVTLPTCRKYQESKAALKELMDEGFEVYATENIVDHVASSQIGLSSSAPWVHMPSFVSVREIPKPGESKEREVKISRQDKIAEAEREFKRIITSVIQKRVARYARLTNQEKQDIIQKQIARRQSVVDMKAIVSKHKPPLPGSDKHVISEEEWLRREQERFQASDVQNSRSSSSVVSTGSAGLTQRNTVSLAESKTVQLSTVSNAMSRTSSVSMANQNRGPAPTINIQSSSISIDSDISTISSAEEEVKRYFAAILVPNAGRPSGSLVSSADSKRQTTSANSSDINQFFRSLLSPNQSRSSDSKDSKGHAIRVSRRRNTTGASVPVAVISNNNDSFFNNPPVANTNNHNSGAVSTTTVPQSNINVSTVQVDQGYLYTPERRDRALLSSDSFGEVTGYDYSQLIGFIATYPSYKKQFCEMLFNPEVYDRVIDRDLFNFDFLVKCIPDYSENFYHRMMESNQIHLLTRYRLYSLKSLTELFGNHINELGRLLNNISVFQKYVEKIQELEDVVKMFPWQREVFFNLIRESSRIHSLTKNNVANFVRMIAIFDNHSDYFYELLSEREIFNAYIDDDVKKLKLIVDSLPDYREGIYNRMMEFRVIDDWRLQDLTEVVTLFPNHAEDIYFSLTNEDTFKHFVDSMESLQYLFDLFPGQNADLCNRIIQFKLVDRIASSSHKNLETLVNLFPGRVESLYNSIKDRLWWYIKNVYCLERLMSIFPNKQDDFYNIIDQNYLIDTLSNHEEAQQNTLLQLFPDKTEELTQQFRSESSFRMQI